jgi:glycosyltransferase involved in cell wall biosynthesis
VNVWIDGVVFDTGPHYGIWRIFFETLNRLADRVEATLWLRRQPHRPLPRGVRVVRDSGRLYGRRFDLISRLRRVWSQRRAPAGLGHADVCHTSYFTACPVEGPARVVSVYDMIAERLVHLCCDWAERDMRLKRPAILGATACVCISQATADDLKRFYPQVAGRVHVIHPGAEHLGRPESHRDTKEPPADEPFALFVGNRDQYKNFAVVLDAMLVPQWPRELMLHVVGSPFKEAERFLIQTLGLENRIRNLGRVSDAELCYQFRVARCLLFPSLLEGFGLPILEAQMNGCPAVLSDIPVFREAAGDGAIFFDPRRAEKLAEAAAAVMEPDVRRRVTEAGYKNTTRFGWDRCAEETLSVYEDAAKHARR